MKFDNQLRYAVHIIDSYRGDSPLHSWLKQFFRENKQMGSKDRKLVSDMVYGFYRLGHAIRELPVNERILTALLLCNDSHDRSGELLRYFKPDWVGPASLSIDEKIALCHRSGIALEIRDIFPWKDELSEDIDHYAFCLSFLRQPDLFVRIRPGFETMVLNKLEQNLSATAHATQSTATLSVASPIYSFIPPFTIRLPNGFKIEELFTPDKELVIQDFSSQRLAPYLRSEGRITVWDACAASGGKSILIHDLNPQTEITVSDIRESILHNLRQRFRTAGIDKYRPFVADLTAPDRPPALRPSDQRLQHPGTSFDLILADVPCTGSGTWSRTPEELYFFDPLKIGIYADKQKKIVSRLIPRLAEQKARLVYSTCSVFKKENEEMAAFIHASSGLRREKGEIIKGYEERADSMFATSFVL